MAGEDSNKSIQDLIADLERLSKTMKSSDKALSKISKESYQQQMTALRKAITAQQLKENLTKAEQSLLKLQIGRYSELDKALQQITKAEKEAREQEEKKIDAVKKSIQAQQKFTEQLIGTYASLGDAQTQNADKLQYFSKSFEGVPLVGEAFHALAKSLDYNIDNYRLLASYGADFGKSLIGLRQAARDAQIPIEEFRNAIGRNTENLAALYGTVNQGTGGFSAMTSVVRRNLSQSFADLGITTEQLLEYQNTYLSRQRIQGRRDFLNNEVVSQQVTAYAKSLNELSRLTGIQNAELDKQVKEQQADGVFQAYLSSLDEKTAMNTQNLIATLSAVNPALGTTAKNLLATGVPLDDLGQELTALAPGFQDAILAFKQSGDVAGTLQNLRNSAQGFQSRFQGTTGAATLLAGGLSDASNSLVKLGSMSLDLAAAQEQQRKAADPLTKELAAFQDSAKRFKAAFENIQTSVLTGFANQLGVSIGGIGNGMVNLAGKITTLAETSPKATAAAIATGFAAKYAYNIGKEILITAKGTEMGIRSSGLLAATAAGGRNLGGQVAGAGKRFAKGGLYGLGAYGVSMGTGMLQNEMGADTTGGKAVGLAGDVISGALTGAAIGSIIPVIGTGVGAAIGGTVSGLYSLATMNKRATGGGLNINTPTLVGERGPELILPKTSGQVVPLMSSANKDASVSTVASAMTGASVDLSGLQNTMNSVRDIMNQSEKHLNKLVSVGLTQVKTTEDVKTAVSKQGGFAYVG